MGEGGPEEAGEVGPLGGGGEEADDEVEDTCGQGGLVALADHDADNGALDDGEADGEEDDADEFVAVVAAGEGGEGMGVEGGGGAGEERGGGHGRRVFGGLIGQDKESSKQQSSKLKSGWHRQGRGQIARAYAFRR